MNVRIVNHTAVFSRSRSCMIFQLSMIIWRLCTVC